MFLKITLQEAWTGDNVPAQICLLVSVSISGVQISGSIIVWEACIKTFDVVPLYSNLPYENQINN